MVDDLLNLERDLEAFFKIATEGERLSCLRDVCCMLKASTVFGSVLIASLSVWASTAASSCYAPPCLRFGRSRAKAEQSYGSFWPRRIIFGQLGRADRAGI